MTSSNPSESIKITGIMEYWNDGMMGETPEDWKNGIVEKRKTGIMVYWNNEIME
jgi:hypothetical protein